MGEVIKTLFSIKFWKELVEETKQRKEDEAFRVAEQERWLEQLKWQWQAQGYKTQPPGRPDKAPEPPPVSGKRC